MSLVEILAGLSEKDRWDMTVLSASSGPLADELEGLNLSPVVVPGPQTGGYSGNVYEARLQHYSGELRQHDPDLIIANTMDTFYAIDAARLLGVPSCWVIREGEAPETFFRFNLRSVQKRALACLNYPERTVFVSQATLLNWPRKQGCLLIRTAPNRKRILQRLDRWSRDEARKHLLITREDLVLLCIGSLSELKGQLDILRAGRSLSDASARLKLIFVGRSSGPYGDAFKRELAASTHEFQSRVLLVEPTSDIGLYYAAADAYVCSSYSESYPRALIESLAAGLPILTTQVRGIPELLGDAAVLTHAPGDVAALKHNISILNISMMRALSDSSSQRWNSLESYESMIEAYCLLIEELTESDG